MPTATSHKQQFLISWFHPTERTLELEAHWWAVGRNGDFGYEVVCAVVGAEDEEAARELITESYGELPTAIHFRFCTPDVAPALSETWHPPASECRFNRICQPASEKTHSLVAA